MKIRIANKIWSTKSIFSRLSVRNILAKNALTTPRRTFCHINLEFTPHLYSGSCLIPHLNNADKRANDAVLVKDRLIAIADGVGAWSSLGVGSGKYSRELLKLVGEIYDKNPNATPKEILLEASNKITEKGRALY
jgi:hypothetical protein